MTKYNAVISTDAQGKIEIVVNEDDESFDFETESTIYLGECFSDDELNELLEKNLACLLYTSSATVLCGKVDAILLTGGIAYSDYVVSRLKKRISFLAPIYVYPGENEMESLAFNAIGALKGELPIQVYK